jgi:hypothetical protein
MGQDHSERIRITTFPNISVMVYPSMEYPGYWRVKSMIDSPDRDTGVVDPFEVPCLFKHDGEPSRETLAVWVRDAVLDQLTHELDEGLLVDGVRVFDPHAEKKDK